MNNDSIINMNLSYNHILVYLIIINVYIDYNGISDIN